MGSYNVTINEAYFANLAAQYNKNFSSVDSALSYAKKTNAVSSSPFDFYTVLEKAIKSKRDGLAYDITCISSVFADADNKLKKRAEDIIGKDLIERVAGGGTVVIEYHDMKPIYDTPRQLDKTTYGYTVDENGNRVYDHPLEQEKYLHRNQGEAYPKEFRGTCGLCASLNILRMAGVNYTEKDVVDYAKANGLCSKGSSDSGHNGGTKTWQIESILEHYGLPSSKVPVPLEHGHATQSSINNLASSVEQGKGVIISVRAYDLCPNAYKPGGKHAIVVTSVVKDSNGNIKGFYVCDSNAAKRDDIPNYYTAEQIRNALTGDEMVVTDSAIR